MSDIQEYLPFIRSRCASIQVIGFEKEDIVQEAVVAVLEYLKECKEKNIEPNTGAVKNVIHRHFFKLIKNNVTFEGCSEKSRKIRRNLARPFSPNIKVNEDQGEADLFDNTESNYDTPYEILANKDIVEKFKGLLTPTELEVFGYMTAGNHKPREICREMYGKKDLPASKTISNHAIKIRKKFECFWLEESGRKICLN